ncbi:MAG TPA: TraB/GumN family protein [Terriglobales bacterium]|nr:TraB/GumN family protein [Terriglobales bacterium]
MWGRIRKHGFLALAVVLATLSAWAQQAAPAQAQPARRFLMWKVTSPTATVYLVGSMHLVRKDVYPLPQAVETAFANSNVLAVEVDVKNVDKQKMSALVQQHGVYAAGDSLSRHISKETAAALQQFCEKYGMPCANLEPLKPWLVSTMVALVPLQKAGADPNGGIDMHFLNQVKASQRIEELETIEYQLSLLSTRSEDEQDKALAYSLNNIGKVHELERMYLAGDADGMLKMMADTPFRELMEKMVDERNVNMTEKVDGFLKGRETYFVVVGAAHVIGDKGIAKLLEKKNYKVEALTFEW